MPNKRKSVAAGIMAGLEEAIAHATGNLTVGTREWVVPDVRSIREKLKLSQAEFSNAFGIPLDTLQNWEQKRRTPDATASSYLMSIDKKPGEIRSALAESKAEYITKK